MAYTHAITLTHSISNGTTTLAKGVPVAFSKSQADTDGKHAVSTLKLSTSTTAVKISSGSVTFGEAFVTIANLSSTTGEDAIIMSAATGGTEITRIKPTGGVQLCRTGDVYAYSLSGTPTLQAIFAQV